jgi:hypothetical protein
MMKIIEKDLRGCEQTRESPRAHWKSKKGELRNILS